MYITVDGAEQFTTERPDVMAFQLVLGKYIPEQYTLECHYNTDFGVHNGCSLELCIATVSVASSDIVPQK